MNSNQVVQVNVLSEAKIYIEIINVYVQHIEIPYRELPKLCMSRHMSADLFL